MAQIPTSNISLKAIQVEVEHSTTTNISLKDQSANAANTTHTSTISGYTSPGGGLTGNPYGMGEFGGYIGIVATTHYNDLHLDSFSSDSNIDCRLRLRAFYSSGDIEVRISGSADNFSPALNTVVFSITNAPSGYTVRRGTFSHNNDIPTVTGTIASSATSIPTTPSSVYVDLEIESGGSFDDPGSSFATGSGSLIFEKSGSTTYTYSFSYSLEAETEGSGGE